MEIIIIGPLPCFLVRKCCNDQGHIINFEDSNYGRMIGEAVKEVGIHLRNLLHMRRIKVAKIVLIGFTGPERMYPREKLVI